uniref:hypothetical protein n=1 Tax=Scandinavium goeteborgense TaxID=1851514 RepID=UPI001CA57467|nr:hypothetical protein [Scandinavium goeteborgense]
MFYCEEFQKALDRSAHFDLAPPEGVSEAPGRLMNHERIAQLQRVLAPVYEGIVSYEQMVGQCMPLHLKARPVLEEWLGCPVYYTLGWIDDGSAKGLHKFDDAMISNKLANGHHDEAINIHAWLTLPTMEIIDLTLSTSISILQGLKGGEGGAIINKADEVTGFTYKPMLVGESFLSKIGILQNVTWYELG